MKEKRELEKDLLHISNYYIMISKLLYDGYNFKKFLDIDKNENYIIMRHDVDFSITSALKLAKIDNDLGINTTFFFQLRSPLYNLLSSHSIESVNEIFNLGHDICLHFDMHLYGDDFNSALLSEMDLFKILFPFCNAKIISFHRIGKRAFELNSILMPEGIEHTYLDKYFVEISYHSDSGGFWKRGNPAYCDDSELSKSKQILTHPMWWCENGNDRFEKINNFLLRNKKLTIDFLEETVLSYSLDSIRRNI